MNIEKTWICGACGELTLEVRICPVCGFGVVPLMYVMCKLIEGERPGRNEQARPARRSSGARLLALGRERNGGD